MYIPNKPAEYSVKVQASVDAWSKLFSKYGEMGNQSEANIIWVILQTIYRGKSCGLTFRYQQKYNIR